MYTHSRLAPALMALGFCVGACLAPPFQSEQGRLRRLAPAFTDSIRSDSAARTCAPSEERGRMRLAVVGEPAVVRAQIEAAIHSSDCCVLVSLKDRERALKEQAMGKSGVISSETAVRTGRLIAASRMVVVESVGALAAVRVINVETGLVELALEPSADRAKLASLVADALEIAPLRAELRDLKFNEESQCEFGLNKSAYRSKEKIAGTLLCPMGGYVALFHVGKEGEFQVLLPRRGLPPVKIEKGRDYAFPSELFPSGFGIELDAEPPYGMDEFVLVVTAEPIDFQTIVGGSMKRGSGAARGGRGVFARVKSMKPGTYSGTRTCFETYRDRPQDLCKDRGL